MSLSIIGAAGAGMGLVDYLNESKTGDSLLDTSVTMASSTQTLAAHTNKKAQNAYGGGQESTAAQEALKRALEELGLTESTVTLAELKRYQEELEEQFSADLRNDLLALGVAEDTAFSLNISANGVVQVTCSDPVAKQKIEDYLAQNPKVQEQFSYIQALSNFGRAQQSSVASSANWQSIIASGGSLTAQHLDALFGDALKSGMNYSPLLADFGAEGGTASFYTGINFTV